MRRDRQPSSTGWGPGSILDHLRADQAPIPAPADRQGYFGTDHLAYWLSGLGDYLFVDAVQRAHGAARSTCALFDLGCASGRVLRHFLRDDR